MKIAVSTQGNSLDAPFDPRFGRASHFVIVDDDTGAWQGYPNPARDAASGAGVQAAQFVAAHGAQAVISGDFGPNAFQALSAAGMEMVLGPDDDLAARAVVAAHQRGQLQAVKAPSQRKGRRRHGLE